MRASSAGPQSPNLVVDSWPVMEWLKGREPVASRFRALLEAGRRGELRLLLSNINVGEIYYNCWREWGEARANEVLADWPTLPVQLVHPTEAAVLAAARVKAQYAISYADAFAVVLAIEFGGSVLTGDRDFLPLAKDSVLNVDWIGA
jgi:predicted nucleic acid-binding protein